MNNSRIIELLKILTSSPEPSRGFETPEEEFERHQQKKHKALLELARLQTDVAVRQMLSLVTREISSSGSIIVSELSGILRDQVLRRVSEYAAILLPEFRRAQAEEAKLTNYGKYLREAGAVDPFLGTDVSLTRDAYSGCGEAEPDTWAQGANLEGNVEMRRKKHSSQPSHTAPPGAAVIKRGELYEVVFSRRNSRIATFGETASDAAAKAWRFWRVGGTPSRQFADLLHKALN